MNTLYLRREQARQVDRWAMDCLGLSGQVLMENAGRGCVESLLRRGVRGPVLVCCGKGNNGGDGLVIARWLAIAGVEARVIVWGPVDHAAADAIANLRILEAAGHVVHVVSDGTGLPELMQYAQGGDWIVDALLGTGTVGAPREPLSSVIEAINQLPAKRCAIDIPSGLDADTGTVSGSVIRADLTCTMVAPKIGFQTSSALPFLGEVEIVSIGFPLAWLRDALPT